MSNPSLAFGALAKPSRLDRDVAKHRKRVAKRATKRDEDREARQIWAEICAVIFERDKGRCRVCARRVKKNADDPRKRAETHHIVYRSAGGEDLPMNLLLTCGICHSLEHQHRIEISGNGNGTATVRHFNAETGKVISQWDSPCPA